MAEVVVTRRFRHWCLFLVLSFLVIFTRLLPLDAGPGRLPGPDLLVCLAFAWVLRRPAYVPVAMIAGVILLTDILFLRPLGLWAFCVVLGSEVLRRREPFTRDLPFLLEWLMVGMVIVIMTLGYTLILAVFAVSQPSIGLTLIQMIATILAYPLVVLFSSRIVGLRKAAPGAVDNLGRKV
ncbi:rod shape-determining protein MreD [Ovoidimarina sediminis]|uniref:rod shape-determining protein MreD n=1 Tax=Ovoidimarina sediminis TaxID=3079856 RepID=UPI00290BC30D|nr:rod shape-determining protein MreD [Rhodophyticola sp. MJ-SS7]MDU8945489.1 rod shape-determining protein MreD [Rhodophyticola sp. MJ-SS7]